LGNANHLYPLVGLLCDPLIATLITGRALSDRKIRIHQTFAKPDPLSSELRIRILDDLIAVAKVKDKVDL
jgi:hypothetical protein